MRISAERRRLLTEGEVMSGGVDMSPKISSWLMFWQRDEIRGQPVRRRRNRNNTALDHPLNPPPPTAFLRSMHHTAHAARHKVFLTWHLPGRCCVERRQGREGWCGGR